MPDEATFLKYCLCRELLVRIRKLHYADPFEGIQEENVCLEDTPRLSIAPGDSDEGKDIIVG